MKINAQELDNALKSGTNVVLLDVRTAPEFREIHIPGSRLSPLDRLDTAQVSEAASESGQCVLVCQSGKRAEQAYQKFDGVAYGNLSVLDGGVAAWEREGLPLERGAKAVSLERQVRIGAGLLVLAGVILGTWVHPALYGLSAFVGAGLTFAGISGWCGMGLLLARMPWNRC